MAGQHEVFAGRPLCGEGLRHYARQTSSDRADLALSRLLCALAAAPCEEPPAPIAWLARCTDPPLIACLLPRPHPAPSSLLARFRGVDDACGRLRYVDYAAAERAAAVLASQLRQLLGDRVLECSRFAAIPRGGHITLGLLQYCLPPLKFGDAESAAPLIVVDDCCLTGAGFRDFLLERPEADVVFAHLYSPPGVRAALMQAEPRLRACVAAEDLHDAGPAELGNDYPEWQQRWLERLPGARCWVGLPEHVAFAWTEPDRLDWDPVRGEPVPGWPVLSPELCLRHRQHSNPVPTTLLPAGTGRLRPAPGVIWAPRPDGLLLGDLDTGSGVRLAGSAALIWEALAHSGEEDAAVRAVLDGYNVEPARALQDVSALCRDLSARGFLVDGGAPR